jgi:hypothetical protein
MSRYRSRDLENGIRSMAAGAGLDRGPQSRHRLFGSLVRPFYSGGPLLLTDAWIDLSHWSDRGDHVHSLALGPALAQQKASRHDVNLQSSIRSFTRPRPKPVLGRAEIPQRSEP